MEITFCKFHSEKFIIGCRILEKISTPKKTTFHLYQRAYKRDHFPLKRFNKRNPIALVLVRRKNVLDFTCIYFQYH
jgi:hypothetical protein